MTTFSGLCIGGPWHGEQRTATYHKITALVHESGDRRAPVYSEWKDAPISYTAVNYWHHVVKDGLREPFGMWIADGVLATWQYEPRDADELVEFLGQQIKPNAGK